MAKLYSGTAKRKVVKRNPLLQLASSFALPAAVAAFLINRWLKSRKAAKGAAPAKPAAKAPKAAKTKPRKNYKLGQGAEDVTPVSKKAAAGQEGDAHDEDEKDGPMQMMMGPNGAQGGNFVQMLQS